MNTMKCPACNAKWHKHSLFMPTHTKEVICLQCNTKLFWISNGFARLSFYILMVLIPILLGLAFKYNERHRTIDLSSTVYPSLVEVVVFSGLILVLLSISFWVVLRIFPGRLSLNNK
jgi:heme A synthase